MNLILVYDCIEFLKLKNKIIKHLKITIKKQQAGWTCCKSFKMLHPVTGLGKSGQFIAFCCNRCRIGKQSNHLSTKAC